jgi:hypothetical protein
VYTNAIHATFATFRYCSPEAYIVDLTAPKIGEGN